MLLSISLILIVGMSMGGLCQKYRLPSLLGMLATGMVLGPYVLNLLDGSILGKMCIRDRLWIKQLFIYMEKVVMLKKLFICLLYTSRCV